MVRHDDGTVRVLYNRCAHKGTPLVSDRSGNTGASSAARTTPGPIASTARCVPCRWRAATKARASSRCESGRGMTAPAGVAVHRDFVFVKLNPGGPDFASYFGEALASIDNLVDRSPVGRLRIDGGLPAHADPLQLEDLPREHQRHGASAVDARVGDLGGGDGLAGPRRRRRAQADGDRADPAVRRRPRLLRPHGRARAAERPQRARHPVQHPLGLRPVARVRSGDARAHGAERAAEILQRSPQNALCYPSLALKGSPQTIRVIRPLAADRTVVEAWSFRVEGAPDLLFERSVTYNRLAFSPMSVVAHDDMHLFQGIQKGLRGEGNEWVSLHRGFAAGELATPTVDVNGTNELLMRNQFRAWVKFMTLDMNE
jgi:hypothetical protein